MESLRKQLESARFERAVQASEALADHRSLLTTAELGRLNGIVTGRGSGHGPKGESSGDSPWREDMVTITLPSGKTETLALIADPVRAAREKLHRATEMAENGQVIDAAVDLYVALVLAHVFKDANRRTAVLAAHYILRRFGVPVSGIALHEIGLGDLREPGQVEALRETVHQMARFTQRRSQT